MHSDAAVMFDACNAVVPPVALYTYMLMYVVALATRQVIDTPAVMLNPAAKLIAPAAVNWVPEAAVKGRPVIRMAPVHDPNDDAVGYAVTVTFRPIFVYAPCLAAPPVMVALFVPSENTGVHTPSS